MQMKSLWEIQFGIELEIALGEVVVVVVVVVSDVVGACRVQPPLLSPKPLLQLRQARVLGLALRQP